MAAPTITPSGQDQGEASEYDELWEEIIATVGIGRGDSMATRVHPPLLNAYKEGSLVNLGPPPGFQSALRTVSTLHAHARPKYVTDSTQPVPDLTSDEDSSDSSGLATPVSTSFQLEEEDRFIVPWPLYCRALQLEEEEEEEENQLSYLFKRLAVLHDVQMKMDETADSLAEIRENEREAHRLREKQLREEKEAEELVVARVHFLVDILPGIHHCALENQAEIRQRFLAFDHDDTWKYASIDLYLVERNIIPAVCRLPGAPESEQWDSLHWLYNTSESALRVLNFHGQDRWLRACINAHRILQRHSARGDERTREAWELARHMARVDHDSSTIEQLTALASNTQSDVQAMVNIGISGLRHQRQETCDVLMEFSRLLETVGRAQVEDCQKAEEAVERLEQVVASQIRYLEESERRGTEDEGQDTLPRTDSLQSHWQPERNPGLEVPRSLYHPHTGEWYGFGEEER